MWPDSGSQGRAKHAPASFEDLSMKVDNMRFRVFLYAVALGCALAHPALAQAPRPSSATGRITGKVYERGKDPAAYVNVIVLGTKQGTQTDESGSFTIVGVPVGTVQLQVQAIGFDKQVKDVQVNAGQTANVEFTLG